MVRLQTFVLATSSGATKKGGGDLQITDLWRLNSDDEEVVIAPAWATSSIDLRNEFIEKQKKQNAAIRDNN